MSNTHSCIICYDFETTGLSTTNDRIIQIGAVAENVPGTRAEWAKLDPTYAPHTVPGVEGTGDGITLRTFQTLVDPGVPIPADATKIHGITDERVRGAPPPTDALRWFGAFITDMSAEACEIYLVGHNSQSYDAPLLQAELARHEVDLSAALRSSAGRPVYWGDTCVAARRLAGALSLSNAKLVTVHARVGRARAAARQVGTTATAGAGDVFAAHDALEDALAVSDIMGNGEIFREVVLRAQWGV